MKMSAVIHEVTTKLQGFTQEQDRYTTITDSGGITANATSLTTAAAVSPGIIEVGDELIYVGSVDTSTKVASALIRGFRGTTPWAYPATQVVVDGPRITRQLVKQAINDTILSLGERFGAVSTFTFQAVAGRITYDVPSDCVEVRGVHAAIPGATHSWFPVRRWKFNRSAGSPSVTGRTVDVYEFAPGRDIQITYMGYASALVCEQVDDNGDAADFQDDDFTDSGLPDWMRDLVTLGACARLVTYMDASGIQVRSGDQHMLNGQSPFGSSIQLSRYLNALFEQKLDQATRRQRQEYDIITHYTG